MRLLFAVIAVGAVATAAFAQNYPPAPPQYGQPAPGYGAPYPDATNNPGYGDRREDGRYGDRDDRRYDDRRGPQEATLFADDDFRGRSITLDRGARRLASTGLEDRISSIGIRSGVWLVCSDDDFRGRCVTLDRSVPRLSAIGMEDNISSIRPLRPRDR